MNQLTDQQYIEYHIKNILLDYEFFQLPVKIINRPNSCAYWCNKCSRHHYGYTNIISSEELVSSYLICNDLRDAIISNLRDIALVSPARKYLLIKELLGRDLASVITIRIPCGLALDPAYSS